LKSRFQRDTLKEDESVKLPERRENFNKSLLAPIFPAIEKVEIPIIDVGESDFGDAAS
jgi:hypothetical protein